MFRLVSNSTIFHIVQKKNCVGFFRAKLCKRNLNYEANDQIFLLKIVIDMGCN